MPPILLCCSCVVFELRAMNSGNMGGLTGPCLHKDRSSGRANNDFPVSKAKAKVVLHFLSSRGDLRWIVGPIKHNFDTFDCE